jgi:hypothetical protein
MLLGVITLEAKPKYRIETWVDNGVRHYLPQKKYGIELIIFIYHSKYGNLAHTHFNINHTLKKLFKIGKWIIKQRLIINNPNL